jgi:hypothetical protein
MLMEQPEKSLITFLLMSFKTPPESIAAVTYPNPTHTVNIIAYGLTIAIKM